MEAPKFCSFCRNPATLQCSGCAQTFYCSANHQTSHWSAPVGHRIDCPSDAPRTCLACKTKTTGRAARIAGTLEVPLCGPACTQNHDFVYVPRSSVLLREPGMDKLKGVDNLVLHGTDGIVRINAGLAEMLVQRIEGKRKQEGAEESAANRPVRDLQTELNNEYLPLSRAANEVDSASRALDAATTTKARKAAETQLRQAQRDYTDIAYRRQQDILRIILQNQTMKQLNAEQLHMVILLLTIDQVLTILAGQSFGELRGQRVPLNMADAIPDEQVRVWKERYAEQWVAHLTVEQIGKWCDTHRVVSMFPMQGDYWLLAMFHLLRVTIMKNTDPTMPDIFVSASDRKILLLCFLLADALADDRVDDGDWCVSALPELTAAVSMPLLLAAAPEYPELASNRLLMPAVVQDSASLARAVVNMGLFVPTRTYDSISGAYSQALVSDSDTVVQVLAEKWPDVIDVEILIEAAKNRAFNALRTYFQFSTKIPDQLEFGAALCRALRNVNSLAAIQMRASNILGEPINLRYTEQMLYRLTRAKNWSVLDEWITQIGARATTIVLGQLFATRLVFYDGVDILRRVLSGMAPGDTGPVRNYTSPIAIAIRYNKNAALQLLLTSGHFDLFPTIYDSGSDSYIDVRNYIHRHNLLWAIALYQSIAPVAPLPLSTVMPPTRVRSISPFPPAAPAAEKI